MQAKGVWVTGLILGIALLGLTLYLVLRDAGPAGDVGEEAGDPANAPARAERYRAAAATTRPERWWEHEPRPTLEGPIDRPFEVPEPYLDGRGRIINPNDCDGDALPDDWEMRRFGTLRYGAEEYMDAPRIDLPTTGPACAGPS